MILLDPWPKDAYTPKKPTLTEVCYKKAKFAKTKGLPEEEFYISDMEDFSQDRSTPKRTAESVMVV